MTISLMGLKRRLSSQLRHLAQLNRCASQVRHLRTWQPAVPCASQRALVTAGRALSY